MLSLGAWRNDDIIFKKNRLVGRKHWFVRKDDQFSFGVIKPRDDRKDIESQRLVFLTDVGLEMMVVTMEIVEALKEDMQKKKKIADY